MKSCPYGGYCIDPGNPSDCEINQPFTPCAIFSSVEEKAKFDALPDKYYFKSKQGGITGFKTQTQLDFFLTDLSKTQKQGASWGTI